MTPQSETSTGAVGLVTSISRKSPRALLVPEPRRRALLGVLAGRHAREGKGAAQVGPVLHLQLVDARGAAAGVGQPQLDRGGRVGDIPQHQAAGKALIG